MQDALRLQTFLKDCQARVERTLDRGLPAAEQPPKRLHQAMRYAVLSEGKRVRPTLAYAGAQALGLAAERVDAGAAAVELIHAYSLIHDDLPAMDDDDLRRGRPSCHKAFDEATAILAGDALQTLAFGLLAEDKNGDTSDSARVQMIAALARAAGSIGMAGGQALDLESEGSELDLVMLENIHIHKTGALIRASVQMAVLACPDLEPEQANALDHYAKCIGLAFQIQDDLLDVEGDTDVIGKQSGADAAHEKATYPSLMGIGPAHEAANDLVTDALESISRFDEGADPLRWIARYIVNRDR
ncbi:(2E,6E)-farnesyl diphosphate synthase [Halochromatium roseum]|uniref:(2E,6E)-farnesyl diphosphate synthase n=1 Tax=Halochromatium roseum TaxID=391920 RepID=UPI0019147A54|nr:farnesyl diphosphate synthase [Halochromatium roseum]MBK5940082.1 (2E,6E)-farnesyl diphosphate synthase [Halochromatium roseum]